MVSEVVTQDEPVHSQVAPPATACTVEETGVFRVAWAVSSAKAEPAAIDRAAARASI